MTRFGLKRLWISIKCSVLWHRHLRPDGTFSFHCLRCGGHIGHHVP